MSPLAGFFIALIILLVVVAARGFRLVRQWEKGLIEQFGRYQKTVDPGLRFIVPFVQNLQRVDMREQVADVPPQEVINRDNVVVTVDAVVYYQATPIRSSSSTTSPASSLPPPSWPRPTFVTSSATWILTMRSRAATRSTPSCA